MGNNPDSSQDFYIGWQANAPENYATKSRRFVFLLALVFPLVAGLLVLTQRGFIASAFEFGQWSEVEGLLIKSPIPQVKIPQGVDVNGNPIFKSILLVGFGKKGALKDLEAMEKKVGPSLYKESVALRGTLIYYDGKTVLELTDGPAAFLGKKERKIQWNSPAEDLGRVKLRGEIYDPKCALGVMKPGNGKPHRSCAIRCISGGIPPVLRVANKEGLANYFLMLDSNGEVINKEVLDFVGDQVQICGRLERQDDWLILYTNPKEDILRLQPHWMEGDIVLCKE